MINDRACVPGFDDRLSRIQAKANTAPQQLLVCVNVDRSEVPAAFASFAPHPTPEHTRVTCGYCSTSCWLSPWQAGMPGMTICFACLGVLSLESLLPHVAATLAVSTTSGPAPTPERSPDRDGS